MNVCMYIVQATPSSQAKGTKSTSFLTHVDVVPLACEDEATHKVVALFRLKRVSSKTCLVKTATQKKTKK